ncbi:MULTISPECIES: hypothetical protein [unclassified Streptomyces]
MPPDSAATTPMRDHRSRSRSGGQSSAGRKARQIRTVDNGVEAARTF